MISPALVSLLLAAAPASAQTAMVQARQAYSTCLGTLLRADLKEKVEPAAFEAKLATACQTQRDAFRRIMISSDVAAGVARATATQGVDDEITDFRNSTLESYRVYFASDSTPR